MAPSPFRRRKAAKTVRNLAIAEAALALAKDRVGKGSRRPSGKLLLIGGAVAAAGAAALLRRDKVAGLLPSHSDEAAPAPQAPPQPSNYDAPGPVANTATPIPAPDPQGEQPAVIDEAAEEAAAAAEAGAIGGTTSDYAGSELGETADEAQIPLAEAGQGESEGQEQAEAELADNATYRDAGLSDSERQIQDTIEQAGQPTQGETPEPLATPGGGISGRPYSGLDADEESSASSEPATDSTAEPTAAESTATDSTAEPTAAESTATDSAPASETATDSTAEPTAAESVEPTGAEPPKSEESSTEEEPPGGGSGDDDWRTWSGRSVNP